MRLLWDNAIDVTTYAFSVSSEVSSYPKENVQDYQLVKVHRTTGDSSEWWKLDAGSGNTVTAAYAAILAHNVTSGATTIKIQANATDVWTSPSLDLSFTWTSAIMIRYFTSVAYRFWRFLVEDASNPAGYIAIGRLMFGAYIQIDEGPYREFPQDLIDTSTRDFSITGQSFGDEGIVYDLFHFTFPRLANTTKQSIGAMFETVKKVKPVVVVPDENNTDKLAPFYAVCNDDLSYNHIVAYDWNGALSFRRVF